MIFNIQDVFPDAAIETGAITNPRIISFARWLERVSYERSDAVAVLSNDLKENVVAKIGNRHKNKVVVIPNFVDAERITPHGRLTSYREELGVGNEVVVMYAGNVGYSQSLEMMIEAAKALPNVTFVINGDGSARQELEEKAHHITNLKFSGYQPRERVPEVLASADIHVVPLRTGLGAVSVPSKTYSILAAHVCPEPLRQLHHVSCLGHQVAQVRERLPQCAACMVGRAHGKRIPCEHKAAIWGYAVKHITFRRLQAGAFAS
jgi:colanic acid biosynthesis glycosyl transferase WcaI